MPRGIAGAISFALPGTIIGHFFLAWVMLGLLIFAWTLLRMIWAAYLAGDLSPSSYFGGTFLLADYNRKRFRILLCAFGWFMFGGVLYNVLQPTAPSEPGVAHVGK
ncbi:hypothetical protein [Bradyrhizobium viridifuturi]|uniref:hypothetical protein n=1 Tax=Bradyrhizobium viridifuturi TaxID=1654716 RepID=UPI00067F3879|nr:hypothetical protein [Bradyrhizobium viridifuturi]